MARPTLAVAKSLYVHRFTMEHVPRWASEPLPNGKHYAPQYRSDAEWYENTAFPGEPDHHGSRDHCNSRNQTWPLGKYLPAPYHMR